MSNLQSRRNEFSQRLLGLVLKPNMTILDIGCGTGELSFLANEILNRQCNIIGIDMNENSIFVAKQNCQDNHITNIQFLCMNVDELTKLNTSVDAIIARRVLMYLPNPMQTLQQLYAILNTNGVIALQETDALLNQLPQNLPLNEHAMRLAWKTVSAENGDIHIGRKLYQMLAQTGFNIQEHFCETTIKTAQTISDLAWLVGVMRDRMESFGLLKDNSPILSALNNNTLAQVLSDELTNSENGIFLQDMAFGIVAKKDE